ncbi:WW domain-containing oxidoreductase [Teleopsis dalmanni]|uniref:WW domain-containing oxidoreductase n=1 Tax=Teleopsis dalmanni TaxID=139649 RepID=UPI0018CE29D9|nr:WW domain-containing oxidoreductase [Teleopsis dalmanni]
MKQSYMPESDSEDELPPGWVEQATDDGLVCYANRQTKVTQWTHPRTGRTKRITGELPIGWEKSTEPDTKRTVFFNKETNQSTYVDPRLAFAVEEAPLDVTKVRQRFDASSTALQVLHGKDLNGRLAVITGANCGIGYETARSLILHGCEVIFACRNVTATQEAIEKILVERPTARSRCRVAELDLGCFKSVRNFVTHIKETVQHIDYLILNAGLFGLPYSLTADGVETTFQVSHLSNFYLTNELEKLFDHKSRIVVLSSESHRMANLPADKLAEQHLSPPPEKYWSMMAYNNAKLCNVLFAQELANRWKARGISVFSVHPGNMISTKIQRNWWFYRLLFALARPFTKSLQQGAATTIYCATANELTGLTGYYFNNCYFCEPSTSSKKATLRLKLWELSEQMVQKILQNPLNKYEEKI